MDEDTKLVLEAWRGLLVENQKLRERIIELELEVRDVTKCIDVGDGFVPRRRTDSGRRSSSDSSD